jgi:putative endonuclease
VGAPPTKIKNFMTLIGCYILHSQARDQYYVGSTQNGIHNRLARHNSGGYGKTFTSTNRDWTLLLFIECTLYSDAIRIERKIKKMKSRKYILNLLRYPEMVDRLKCVEPL